VCDKQSTYHLRSLIISQLAVSMVILFNPWSSLFFSLWAYVLSEVVQNTWPDYLSVHCIVLYYDLSVYYTLRMFVELRDDRWRMLTESLLNLIS